MTPLSDRFANATAEDQRELLEELAKLTMPQFGETNTDAYYWIVRKWSDSFHRLLTINTDPAFLAAALMLVPEDKFRFLRRADHGVGWEASCGIYKAGGQTPALALGFAIARNLGL